MIHATTNNGIERGGEREERERREKKEREERKVFLFLPTFGESSKGNPTKRGTRYPISFLSLSFTSLHSLSLRLFFLSLFPSEARVRETKRRTRKGERIGFAFYVILHSFYSSFPLPSILVSLFSFSLSLSSLFSSLPLLPSLPLIHLRVERPDQRIESLAE